MPDAAGADDVLQATMKIKETFPKQIVVVGESGCALQSLSDNAVPHCAQRIHGQLPFCHVTVSEGPALIHVCSDAFGRPQLSSTIPLREPVPPFKCFCGFY